MTHITPQITKDHIRDVVLETTRPTDTLHPDRVRLEDVAIHAMPLLVMLKSLRLASNPGALLSTNIRPRSSTAMEYITAHYSEHDDTYRVEFHFGVLQRHAIFTGVQMLEIMGDIANPSRLLTKEQAKMFYDAHERIYKPGTCQNVEAEDEYCISVSRFASGRVSVYKMDDYEKYQDLEHFAEAYRLNKE